MLEQRRAKQKGYITLKEAAELSNYTSDYVGQLIRAGKIQGEQVYSGVAWMTTEEEVHAYLNDKQRSVGETEDFNINTFVSRLRFQLRPYRTLLTIALFGSAILAMQYAVFLNARSTAYTADAVSEYEVALRSNYYE